MSDADAHIDAKTFPYTRPASDHADTIRRALTSSRESKHTEARAALDALVAERQQAIDERDAARRERDEANKLSDEANQWVAVTRQSREILIGKNEQVCDALDALDARCEQAIDALRRIELWPFDVGSTDRRDLQRIKACARAALVSLGEKP